MKIDGSVALVTGANRGLGRAYARELVKRGAAKVYGAARDPAAVTEPGVTPIALDITDAGGVAQVAAQCTDVSLLVNNAGVLKYSTFIGAPNLDAARAEMEVNYFGTLSMCRAFAPVLAANGGGAIVNMLSVSSFYTNPLDASYGASKAAGWSLTNGVRLELTTRTPWWSPCTPASSTPIWRPWPPTCPKTAPDRSPSRSSTLSRPARSRSSPTSGPAPSRHSCHATRS
jgi:NAD(P)-dependent dehydrogenase (short-subunit alcohol dehydrogenase family)